MKNRQCLDSVLLQKLAILVVALLLALSLATVVRAESLSHYQPQALIDAESALDEGQPERALAHLHRGRAVLRDARFSPEREALACEAYIQLREREQAARVCKNLVAYDNAEKRLKGAYEPAR